MVTERTDVALTRWVSLAVLYPRRCVGLCLLITAFLLSGLGWIEIETSTESFLSRDDPARVRYDNFRAEFGNDDATILTLYAERPLTREFLERLVALHYDLDRSLPYVKEITSLLNARATYGSGNDLIVEDLLEGWPLDDHALARARSRIDDHPAYRNALISEDGHYTSITVELVSAEGLNGDGAKASDMLSSAERERFVDVLGSVVARHAAAEFPVWVTGREPLASAVLRAIRSDMVRFGVAAIALIAIALFALFRRTSGVVFPLGIVSVTLLATFGAMGWAGVAISPTTQILPSFLLAVGVGDAIHILAIYYRRLDRGVDHTEALLYAYEHSGFAVVMTSLTTAVCLASFLTAELPPISGLGIAAVVGVLLALLYTVFLLPAVMTLVPIRVRVKPSRTSYDSLTDRILVALANVGTQRPWPVVIGWGAMTCVAAYGAGSLHFEHKPVEWFRPSNPTRAAIQLINRTMHAGGSYQVIVDTGRADGIYDPEVLRKMDAMRELAETTQIAGFRAGRAISVVDVLKETHRALNANDQSYFSIADDRELVAQELLLFEMSGSNDIEDMIDEDFRKARMTLLVPIVDGFDQRTYMNELEQRLRRIARPDATIDITGYSHIGARTTTAMVVSMVRSYTIALLTLTPIMVLLAGNLRRGLLSMLPNIAPIVMSLGLMYALGIPLDIFSTLIGSIAIGVAVDDTIHFVHNFGRYRDAGRDPQTAVHETMMSVGRALLVTSLVLVCGFLVFARATMVNIVDFGVITAFTVTVAFLADATLTPALLVLASQRAPVGATETSPQR